MHTSRGQAALPQKQLTAHPERNATILNCWLFICGALSTFDVQIIGRVTVAEILVFLSMPLLFFTKKITFWNGNFLRCTAILVTMCFATIIADHYNGFIFELSARAFARPVFIFGFLLFFVLVLAQAPRSLVWFIYGLLIAGIINYFRPSQFEKDTAADATTYSGLVFRLEPLIYSIAVAGSVWLWLKNRLAAACIMIAAIVTLALLGASRSGLLVYIVALFIMIALLFINRQGHRRFSLTRNRLIGLSLTAFAAVTLAYISYINLAPAGVLGEDQRIKFEEQTTTTLGTSPLGLVLGGRPQVYGAILGIKERPILGFGSWRHDLTSVFVVDAFTDVGNDPRLIDQMNKTGAVSGAGHSVLFQAWVENGIVPATCWILIAFIALKVSAFNIQNNNIYTAFFIINLGAFLWTFFFSPPPVFLRYLVGIYMAYYVVFLDKKAPLRHAGELC